MLNHIQIKRFYAFFLLISLLSACATPAFKAGADKNSMPLFGKHEVAAVRVLSIPPFFGDEGPWRELAADAVAHGSQITVISSEQTDAALIRNGVDLSSVSFDKRPEVLVRTGRSVNADAVLNGLIIRNQKSNEIILQLISTQDSRILWWQAVDFADTKGGPSDDDRKALLTHMLSQFYLHAGKSEKPMASVPVEPKSETRNGNETEQKTEQKSVTTVRGDLQQKSDIKKKPPKKRGRDGKPGNAPGTISPM